MKKQETKKTVSPGNSSGIALILVLGVLAILVILATTFAFNMRLEQKAASNYCDSVKAKDLSTSGVENVIAVLKNDAGSDPPTTVTAGVYLTEVMANTIAYWDFNESAGATADNKEGTAALDGAVSDFLTTGTADAGTDDTHIVDDALLDIDDVYNTFTITNDATGESETISDYDGSIHTITSSAFTTVPVPTTGTNYTISTDWTSGKYDNALIFDGSDDQVDCSSNSAFDIEEAITLACWVMPGKDQTGCLISKDDAYFLKLNSSGGNGFSAGVKVNTVWKYCHSSYDPTMANWYHVGATYDSSAQKLRIIVKDNSGNIVAQKETDTGSGNIDTNANHLYIGTKDGSTEYFAGLIDEPRVYEGAEDYVELYNFDSSSQSVNGWTITDTYTSLTGTLPNPCSIPALSHMIFTIDNLFYASEWVYSNVSTLQKEMDMGLSTNSFCLPCSVGAGNTLTLSGSGDTLKYIPSAINCAWEKGDDPSIDTVHIASCISAANSEYGLYGTPTTCNSISPLMKATNNALCSCMLDSPGNGNWYSDYGNVDLDGDGETYDFTINQSDISDEQGKININTANAALLAQLSNIDSDDAADIVDYRTNVCGGSFNTLKQIMLVDSNGNGTGNLIFTKTEYDNFKDYITVSSWINKRVYDDEEDFSSLSSTGRAPININTVSETVFKAVLAPIVSATDIYDDFETRINGGDPFNSRSEFNKWIDDNYSGWTGFTASKAAEVKDNADPSGADYQVTSGLATDYDCLTTEFCFNSGDPSTGAGGAFRVISTGVDRDPAGETAAEKKLECIIGRMSPSAHWDFNDNEPGGTTTTAKDLYNSNDGTLTNFASYNQTSGWVMGRFGPCLAFDGTNDYVNVGEIDGNATAITLWFYNDGVIDDGTSAQVLLQVGTSGNGLILGSCTATLTNEIITVTDTGSDTSGWCSDSASISVGWHHLAIVFDSTTPEWNIYLDGNQKTITTSGTPKVLSLSNVQIGRKSTGDYFDGKIDEVRIYEDNMRIIYTREVID